jgi:hypothetical protein
MSDGYSKLHRHVHLLQLRFLPVNSQDKRKQSKLSQELTAKLLRDRYRFTAGGEISTCHGIIASLATFTRFKTRYVYNEWATKTVVSESRSLISCQNAGKSILKMYQRRKTCVCVSSTEENWGSGAYEALKSDGVFGVVLEI